MSESESETFTDRIAAGLLAAVRGALLAVGWLLSVVWLAVATVWDAATGQSDPGDDGE